MTRRILWTFGLMLIAAYLFPVPTSAQDSTTLPRCDTQEVEYGAFDPSFAKSIVVSEVDPPADFSTSKERTFTVQHTRWLIERKADFSKPGPWTTTILIGGIGYKSRALQLSFRDHGSGGVQVQWLNEKLLFAEVWWGRIVSVDLILDVQRKKFLYEEMADCGEIGQPCNK